jgi:hypothetical protein
MTETRRVCEANPWVTVGRASIRGARQLSTIKHGGRSSVGRASDCDSECRGFKPRRSPIAHRSVVRYLTRSCKAQPKAAQRFSSNLAKPNFEAFGCEPLMSGRVNALAHSIYQSDLRDSERGEIGRHAGFRFPCRKAWGFKSLRSHSEVRGSAAGTRPSMLTTARTRRDLTVVG